MSQILDKKLHSSIDKLNEKQKKVVYSVIRAFIEESKIIGAQWDDPAFVEEMDRRQAYYLSGAPMVTADEVKKQLAEIMK